MEAIHLYPKIWLYSSSVEDKALITKVATYMATYEKRHMHAVPEFSR